MAIGANGVHGAIVRSRAAEGRKRGHESATTLSQRAVENPAKESVKILSIVTLSIVDVSK